MAHLPRAGSELHPLKPLLAAALVVTLAAAARPARTLAQEEDPAAQATARVEVGAASLADTIAYTAGAQILFRVARRVEVGGAARIDLTHPSILTAAGALEARFGYAGLIVALRPAPALAPDLRIGALLGAGNVHLRDPGVETVLDSDNGLVIEPHVSGAIRVLPKVKIGLTAGWRLTSGFEVLGGLDSSDLRGGLLLAGIELGAF